MHPKNASLGQLENVTEKFYKNFGSPKGGRKKKVSTNYIFMDTNPTAPALMLTTLSRLQVIGLSDAWISTAGLLLYNAITSAFKVRAWGRSICQHDSTHRKPRFKFNSCLHFSKHSKFRILFFPMKSTCEMSIIR